MSKHWAKWVLFTLFLGLFHTSLWAKTFTTNGHKVHLIELYTSQSCSSCPPAEQWLSRMTDSSQLWKDFIPLSYHVSYWNYLSWRDPFSKQAFSQRQRDYHRVIQGGVYTPQVVFDGADDRRWHRKSPLKPVAKKTKTSLGLEAQLNIKKAKAQLKVLKIPKGKKVTCFAAYLENGHQADVKAGENEGRRFKQDFVVRHLYEATPTQETCHFNLTKVKTNSKIQQAYAFWVIDQKTYEVLQATGGLI